MVTNIASTLHQEAANAMPREYMNSAMLFDSCQLLIVHEHAIDTAAFPSPTEVSIKQGLASINLKGRTDFQIPPESFRAIICDVDYCFFAAFAFDTEGQ